MRDYIFRGKRKDNGEWAEGSLVSITPDEAFILLGVTGHIKRDDYECYMVEVDPGTVGMWTFLNDAKGNKIFAGDKLRGFQKEQSDKEGKYVFEVTDTVTLSSGGFKVFGKHMQGGYTRDNNILYQFMWCSPGSHGSSDRYYQIDAIEIIGSIHDVKPAVQDSVIIDMQDPNLKAAEQEAAGAAEEVAATESAAQDTAMEATDNEEGTTQV